MFLFMLYFWRSIVYQIVTKYIETKLWRDLLFEVNELFKEEIIIRYEIYFEISSRRFQIKS